MNFIHPVDNYLNISSGYGIRKDPFTGKLKPHKGIDYKIPLNTPVKASESGKIVFAGKKEGYGNHIIISHPNNFYTLYAHLNTIKIKNNDNVLKGDTIGYSGDSGRSTGAHLHFEIRINKESIDPSPYLNINPPIKQIDLKPIFLGSLILFLLFKK